MNTGITDKMLLTCLLLVTFVDGHDHTKLRKKLTIKDYIKPKQHFVLPEQSAFHKVSVKTDGFNRGKFSGYMVLLINASKEQKKTSWIRMLNATMTCSIQIIFGLNRLPPRNK